LRPSFFLIMKLVRMLALHVFAVLVVTSSARFSGLHPDSTDAFRSDSTLSFMRHLRKQVTPEVPKSSEQMERFLDKQQKPPTQAPKAARSKDIMTDRPRGSILKGVDQPLQDFMKGQQRKPKDAKPLFPKDLKDADEALEKFMKGKQQPPKEAPKKPVDVLDEKLDEVAEEPKDGRYKPVDVIDKDLNELTGEKGRKKRKASKAKRPKLKAREASSVAGCSNSPPGWADAKGNDCEDYAEGEFCTRHGGYGDAWLDEWGTFEDAAYDGKSAKQVCCFCGGGLREAAGPAPAAAPSAAAPGEPVPLQAQGFSGDLVVHEDGESITGDWGREFGPRAQHRDIRSICNDHPDNAWCLMHGYNVKIKSGVSFLTCPLTLFSALMLAFL